MSRFLTILSPAVAVCSSASLRAAVTPIEQVLNLLEDMSAKGAKEKHEEEVEFAKFHEWCDSTRAIATRSIAEGKAQLEQLDAELAKAEADASELAADVQELEASVGQAEKELGEGKGLREKEHTDYSAQHADFSESVDALERAIAVLKARSADVPQSLLQLQASTQLPAEAKAVIESFLAASSSEEAFSPEANAYESQSGGVVNMLEKLRLKFQDQRTGLEKEEMNARHNFEMLAQKLTDNIQQDSKIAAKKTATKAQRLADAAGFKGDLKSTAKAKAEDEKSLSDTTTACHARSEEFEKNQVIRAEEVKAIKKAVAILDSEEVSGTAEKHLPSLAQVATALVQLRGNESPQEVHQREKLVQLLQDAAKHTGSQYLNLVASHASAGDPFEKVKKMIKGLIVKLMEQANSEAEHKAYCDTELATNKQTREIKTAEVDELSASMEKHVAESAQLAEEIAQASDAVTELRKQQADATKLRNTEKALNAQTVAEAKAAQVAVERATLVLKDFYGKVADTTLLQGSGSGELRQEMNNAAQEPYKGMLSESGGILGFLDVILSDFARLETATSSAEDQAATAYDKFMDESNQDISVKEAEVSHKTGNLQQTDAKIDSLKSELQLTQKELDAALEYYEKLKPDCVAHDLSYTDRVHMREEEIQSLKEALQILNQQDLD